MILSLHLGVFQSGIGAVSGQKLCPRTLFDDMLAVNDGDAVGVSDCGKPVRDHDAGFAAA